METVLDGIEHLEAATLDGLDQSQQALDQLQEQCRQSAELLLTDLVNGATATAEAAGWVHDFIAFEHEVVTLFDVDTSRIVVDSDSLHQAEQDMNELLKSFNVKMDSMDVVGVAELMRDSMPAMLNRFRTLLMELRVHIHDLIDG